jgi:peptidoglycan-associated lipoprotein
VKAAERAKLQAAKDYLEKHPDQRLLLEGHCDWRGTAEYNLGLGDRRANAARRYLISIGVAADKLESLSKGYEGAMKNADEATMAKDRRAEIVILKKS